MNGLSIGNFDEFFHELHGYAPYPWQRRLADKALSGNWPGAIDLPTGSGKTACIDIAIFALACQASRPLAQRDAPRRLFFCVNRRIIVDEAHTRAQRIAQMIWQAESGLLPDKPTLREVAHALRIIAGTTNDTRLPPIDVVQLRGGIYRDSRWARSITQPTIVCTTLDQLGSRLLFRGYGVSPNAAPIQAALIAYDSLVLLDEAHISEPFRQTLGYVTQYLNPNKWAEQAIGVRPMRTVPMTATPTDEMRTEGIIEIEADDRENDGLNRRLTARKPAELKEVTKLADAAVKAAVVMSSEQSRAIGIIVNRIATAKDIYAELREMQGETSNRKRKVPADAVIELVIGSMRPADRDAQSKRLTALVGSERPNETKTTSFVVATQCLEVGADYDFDALVTECASLDALRQRFGRLNRGGRQNASNEEIETKAVIFMERKAIKSEEAIQKIEKNKNVSRRYLDPIYGNAMARTWNWLKAQATGDTIDFGIDAFSGLLYTVDGELLPKLLAPSASARAPTMLPAYVDFWCQTAPRPEPDPEVSLFIHGPRSGEPDVQVCWRADLVADSAMTPEQWCDVVALLPPTSAECISLPVSRLRRWLANESDESSDADLLGIISGSDETSGKPRQNEASAGHPGVLWRGAKKSRLISSPQDLRPGDTLVLPASDNASRSLGHLPDAECFEDSSESDRLPIIRDVADAAMTRARDKAVLRLHPSMRPLLPVCNGVNALLDGAAKQEEPLKRDEWKTLLAIAAREIRDLNDILRYTLQSLSENSIRIEPYPDKRGVVLATRGRLDGSRNWFIRPMDEGDDESSRTQRTIPVELSDHSVHVRDAASQACGLLPLETMAETSALAAYLHDWGKADERFQAMLRRTDRTDAWLFAGTEATILAKSDGMPTTRGQRKAARERAGLPAGFRHEMLSVQMIEHSGLLPDDAEVRTLILHLVAAHHGYARPFAPVVIDDEFPSVAYEDAHLSHEQRTELTPSHRLDSGIAERFWTLTRRFGWWGLAYLEAVLRLSDQQASAGEDAGKYDTSAPVELKTEEAQ